MQSGRKDRLANLFKRIQTAVYEPHHRLPLRVASLARVKGLAITVVVTLALGIGANAAIFSVVRGVLLRPLVNRDEDRLIYIRQSAQGIGASTTRCSRSPKSTTCGRG